MDQDQLIALRRLLEESGVNIAQLRSFVLPIDARNINFEAISKANCMVYAVNREGQVFSSTVDPV